MMSEIPARFEKVAQGDLEKEILRIGMVAELDAINLYEQMAAQTKNPKVRATLLDIAKEEKTHVGEFQALLLMHDKEQVRELAAGAKEVEAQA
jgi:rubrerythrin